MGHSSDPDIASAAFKADPFPYFAWLRATAPVHRVQLPNGQHARLIVRYGDVVSALKDERLVKDKRNAMSASELARQPWIPRIFEPIERNMLDLDPPEHTRLRALVHRAFTPRLVEGMGARVRSLAHRLLDDISRRGAANGFDLIADYALPIPTTVIAEMLGIPPEERRRFHRWSSAIISSSSSRWGAIRAIPSVLAFMRYVRTLLRVRRLRAANDDLLGALVNAHLDGEQFTGDQLVGMVFLLLVAGHETTVNLIGNGVLALLDNPGQLERLRGDPSLMRSASEELLRYAGPLDTATERFAREDIEIAGVRIPHGSLVYAALASANRDDAQFASPDILDLSRQPNRHVAFGQGVHFCLGAPLARLEGQIALEALLERTHGLELAIPRAGVKWRKGLVIRGVTALPVRATLR